MPRLEMVGGRYDGERVTDEVTLCRLWAVPIVHQTTDFKEKAVLTEIQSGAIAEYIVRPGQLWLDMPGWVIYYDFVCERT